MASSRTINCLDLGTQTVALAQFSPTAQGGLNLEGYQTAELMADPAAEASRIPQLRLALKDIASQKNLKKAPAIYALPGQAIFSRCVMLPAVEQGRVEQIIGFEAQQNVPFPLTEVVWDYQLIERSSSETELVLIAVRKELLNDVNEAVEDAGFTTDTVDVAPLAVFNAFRFNYPEVTDCTLILDIGARTTNLIFIEKGLLFVRVLLNGGNSVTAAVAKEFNEDYQEAEARKVRDGFVNLGGAYEDPADPEVATLSKVIRNAMTKLHAEISRNIGYYRANLKGEKPQRVLLAGGGTSLPFTREFFAEKFGMSVEYFNPLKNVTVAPSMAGNAILNKPHLLGELVGLALRSQGGTPSEVNLRPASVRARQESASRQPFFAAAGACVLLAGAAWYLYTLNAATITQGELEELNPKVGQLQNFEKQIKAADAELKQEAIATAPLVVVTDEREYWTGMLDDLNAALPQRNIWITAIEPVYIGNILPPGEDGKIKEALEGRMQQRTLSKKPKPPTPAVTSKTKSSSSKKEKEEEPVPEIDMIQVKGLFLENNRPIVVEFVNRLKTSEYFDVPANADDVIELLSAPNQAVYANEYELLLPLKKKLPLK